ncbi:uncharacterized protein YbcV (DUF1398 family) [Chryseobacterium sp. SORGH_AS 447]|uniref:DUF1398 domain-containing protein n=1 Tax=Chryseobacterium sp. SORGH_AS_0447 TaxID=3041769 RepID=UPI0027870DC4|nr:DUF1398 family protein [Chryseobacterium sp. SORGH_AS_0447]MDQ1160125.1 uncharacterized protein YbcV (DUF1398 family) [Chryseobacterium sp. SORGH_AS_0447]
MFTVEQIETAHAKVKSGADFPDYIEEIKQLGVQSFETWVKDSHTEYFGENGFRTKSQPRYAELTVADETDQDTFIRQLKSHQKGETDYMKFCEDCAATGVEKWIVDLNAYTCMYYDKAGNEILTEEIPH